MSIKTREKHTFLAIIINLLSILFIINFKSYLKVSKKRKKTYLNHIFSIPWFTILYNLLNILNQHSISTFNYLKLLKKQILSIFEAFFINF